MSEVAYFRYSPLFEGLLSDVVSIPLGDDRKLLMLSGVAAEDPEGRPLTSNVPLRGDIEGQIRSVFARIDELLGKHGGSVHDVVKATFYLTDSRHLLHPLGDILMEVFKGANPPACTGVVVTGLAHPELLVEIDVTAVVTS